MSFRSEIIRLSGEVEQVLNDQQRSSKDGSFLALKNETLALLSLLYGEASREFRVVKLTSSPATVIKVLNHIAARGNIVVLNKIAANM